MSSAASADEILEILGPGRASATSWPATCPRATCGRWASPSAWPPTPPVLLLDEPFAGMNHDETMRTVELVRGVRDRGVTVLLVEHDMAAVMKISDRIVVLNFGEKIAEGSPAEIQRNEKRDRGLSRQR